MSTYIAEPLAPATLPSTLSIISPLLTTDKTRIGNGGTSTRTADIVECVNNYHNAPSRIPGRAIMSSSRNVPRKTWTEEWNGKVTRFVEVEALERHPYTTQSFSPLGGRPDEDKQYLVVVADGKKDEDRPDMDTLRAFFVKGNEGVCYKENAWHAPMCVLSETTDFSIFQFGNGVPDEDCELIVLEKPVRIAL